MPETEPQIDQNISLWLSRCVINPHVLVPPSLQSVNLVKLAWNLIQG
jgi:hypothetical protein